MGSDRSKTWRWAWSKIEMELQFLLSGLVVAVALSFRSAPPELVVAAGHAVLSDRSRSCVSANHRRCSGRGSVAECQFVDPIADIAVLGSVDGQELYDEVAAYDDLTDEIPAPIADRPRRALLGC